MISFERMRHRLFYHITWTTRDRQPSIDRRSADLLSEILPRIATNHRCLLLELGTVSNHLHLLIRSHPSTNIPELIQRMKGLTGYLIRKETKSQLTWTKGYNIESVSQRSLGAVIAYIRSQAIHHPDLAIPCERVDSSTIHGQQ